jgi:NADH-quinone oxidoreductase subunit G
VAEEIPRYCYHPGMPIAGTCRMCTVEVEKAPKLMTSCSTPAGDGMVVHTKSPKVMKSRTGVMEFLLTNHPLDCPVCDKAGECELQDYNFEYGPHTSNFKEEKRVFKNATTKALSDKITLNMNRCVHCERCVRFTDDVTKTHDLVMLNRGYKKELAATDEEVGLTNDYQGCLTDFCPVGALTMNDFRFEKRAWFLTKAPSICDQCSKGCNMEVHSEHDVIYRQVPIYNEKVNQHWMCDAGRTSYHGSMDPMRIVSPLFKHNNELHSTSFETLFKGIKAHASTMNSILVVIGTDATREEAANLKEKMSSVFKNKKIDFVYHNGTNGVTSSKDDKKMDHLLIMKDKTPNTLGVEELGLSPLQGEIGNYDLAVIFRNGKAGIPKMKNSQKLLLWGVWTLNEIKSLPSTEILGVIPGLATAEKEGSYKNTDGIIQKFRPAIAHKGQGAGTHRIFQIWNSLN